MTRTLTAVFDGGVLRPDGTLDLKPNARYRVTVEDEIEMAEEQSAWDVLEQLAGTVDAPADPPTGPLSTTTISTALPKEGTLLNRECGTLLSRYGLCAGPAEPARPVSPFGTDPVPTGTHRARSLGNRSRLHRGGQCAGRFPADERGGVHRALLLDGQYPGRFHRHGAVPPGFGFLSTCV